MRLFETMAGRNPTFGQSGSTMSNTRGSVSLHVKHGQKKGCMCRDHILSEFSRKSFLGNLSNKLFSEEKFRKRTERGFHHIS